MSKPQNHVTRALSNQRSNSDVKPMFRGSISKDLLTSLSEAFPPRCKKIGESEEEHQRYAGKVELIAALRESEEQKHIVDDEDLSQAERA